MSKEYRAALEQAKENWKDFKERGKDAIGADWRDVRKRLFTPEQLATSENMVKLVGELIQARQSQGISQRQLAEMSGVNQPTIAKIESFDANPRTDTLSKLLRPLGMRLTVEKAV